MKISHHWLNDYISLDKLEIEAISDHLTLLGLEVDTVHESGNKLEGVVIGLVKEVSQHPNADRLRICQVDLGTEHVQIVCGADNVAAGQKVPVATIGSVLPISLPDGSLLKIKKGKLRGEASMGMICAEDELGLGNNHDGIMVFDDADNRLQPGTHISSVVELSHDYVYEIELTPNRPDASCHFGVARDLSAKLKLPLRKPTFSEAIKQHKVVHEHNESCPDIEILAPELCHRYVGIRISGVAIKESPTWLKQRLESIGLRSINNVVDATNYVMMSLGQPLHAFDARFLADEKIQVKTFDHEQLFVTLDEEERNVPAGSLFICDGEGPVALAGIMGGMNSEVRTDTTDILLESAYFDPVSVRKTSKAIALQTDSSYRFERGIDPNGTLEAALYCADLILQLAGGTINGDILDLHPKKTAPVNLSIRTSFTNQLLGIDLSTQEIADILEALEFQVEIQGESCLVVVPTFRPDIQREVDLVEEVVRVYDINAIPRPQSGHLITPSPLPEAELLKEHLKKQCVALGFQEIYTNSLLPEEASEQQDLKVRTLNPLSSEMSVLRDNLEVGMLRSVAHNYKRQAQGMRFFELGHVFSYSGKEYGTYHTGVIEEERLQLSLSGQTLAEDWMIERQKQPFFELKAAVYSLLESLGLSATEISERLQGDSLQLKARKKVLAEITLLPKTVLKSYKIKQAVATAQLKLEPLLQVASLKKKYRAIPKYPVFEFDIAFLTDKQTHVGLLTESLRKGGKDLLRDILLFDVYEGDRIPEGKKSVAYRLNFQADKTLTAKHIEPIIKKMAATALKEFGAELRDA